MSKVQASLEPENWNPFDEVGADMCEIRIREASGAFRVMYVAKFEEAVYVLHCFQKKTQATSQPASRINASSKRATGFLLTRGKQTMKIDTEIHHVTKPGANLFLELGFPLEGAKQMHRALQQQINDTRQIKEQLMTELAIWIDQHHLKQAQAAEILMVSRSRVSDVVNKKTTKFTIDALIEMLSRLGKPVRLQVGQ